MRIRDLGEDESGFGDTALVAEDESGCPVGLVWYQLFTDDVTAKASSMRRRRRRWPSPWGRRGIAGPAWAQR
jgi:hypothetical protein